MVQVGIDWTRTVRESVTPGIPGLALSAIMMLAYFQEKLAGWWRRKG